MPPKGDGIFAKPVFALPKKGRIVLVFTTGGVKEEIAFFKKENVPWGVCKRFDGVKTRFFHRANTVFSFLKLVQQVIIILVFEINETKTLEKT